MADKEDNQIVSPVLMIELKGQVERITYHNAENGYTVLRLSVRDHAELITAVGLMAEPAQGEMLTLSGRWEENAKYGMQFHIYKCESTLPATVTGIRSTGRWRRAWA